MSDLTIAGLKQSGELSMVTMDRVPGGGLGALCRRLASQGINLAFLAWQNAGGKAGKACLCVQRGEQEKAWDSAQKIAAQYSTSQPQLTSPVLAVSLYPRDQGMEMPLEAWALLSSAGMQPLALGTSLSAVVIIISEADGAKALSLLGSEFNLPSGASGPAERVRVTQTGRGRA